LPKTTCPECGAAIALKPAQLSRLRYRHPKSIWSGVCPKCGAWLECKLERNGRHGEGFYLDFTVRGRRVGAWGGKTLTEAKIELGRLRAEMTAARKVPSKDVMFSEFGREFLDLYSKPNKRSWRRDVVSVNSLSAFFHGKTLRSLAAEAVERFKATRLTQVSPATVNRELACLRTLLNKAMEWARLESNPAARVKKLREAPPRERILTDADTR
jgi:hypothetical protein